MTDVKKIGRFQALWMSFYSAEAYVACAREWGGIGGLYLLLVLTLSWVPMAIQWNSKVRTFASTAVPAVQAQLPTITIKDGIMTSQPPGRHVIRIPPIQDEPFLIVDDSIDEVPATSDSDVLYLTRREAGTIQPKRNERRIWALTGQSSITVTPDGVGRFFRALSFWILPLGFLFAIVGSLVFRLVQILIYGAVGQLLAQQQKVTLEYVALVRMSALALTPVIALQTVMGFMSSEPAWYLRWPLAIAIALGYLWFGIRALAGSSAVPPVPRSTTA